MSIPGVEPPYNQSAEEHEPYSDSNDSYPVPKKPKKSKKYIGLGILAVLMLVAAAYGVVKLAAKKPAANTTHTQQPASNTSTAGQDVPNTDKTTDYENGFLGIKLTYPNTWTAAESDSKDSVRLESPSFSYKTVDQRSVTGNFRIYIRKGARDIDGKYIGRGVALRPSEKLVYKQPSPGQRTETSLTLFGVDTPDNFALFLIAGNYNINKGDTLGPNYGKEPDTYIVGGGFSSKELKDDLATNAVSPELLGSSNAYKQSVEILKSLQLR